MPDEPTVPMPERLHIPERVHADGDPKDDLLTEDTPLTFWDEQRAANDAALKARATVTIDRACFDAMVEALRTAEHAVEYRAFEFARTAEARARVGIALQMLRDRGLI